MATDTPMLPMVSHPRVKPGGKPFTEDDKEFHLLERDGGIRQYRHLPYPAMLYRGERGLSGKVELEQRIVGSEQEADEARRDGWYAEQQAALDGYEKGPNAIAQAAAEVAHAVQRMSPKARAEYAQRSAATEDHITE